jgi:hypothetical protein
MTSQTVSIRITQITDEYLIPMGTFNSMAEVVDDAANAGIEILTFRSTRASPIYSFME